MKPRKGFILIQGMVSFFLVTSLISFMLPVFMGYMESREGSYQKMEALKVLRREVNELYLDKDNYFNKEIQVPFPMEITKEFADGEDNICVSYKATKGERMEVCSYEK